jgi:hypothetical protein
MAKPSVQNAPVQHLRHRRIKAAIWENQGPQGPFYTVTITRSYKQDEVWRDSHSFNHDDLLVVAKLMNDAHTAISALLQKAKESRPSPELQRRRTKT